MINMVIESIKRLRQLCKNIPPLLLQIPEKEFSFKPSPAKWSKKEILGHLIDSAANNHQRFVRVQFENVPLIEYDQNKWNSFSYHQAMNGKSLIHFWQMYNEYLANIAEQIPVSMLQRECNTGDDKNVTLEFIITDYVTHMEHHLHQIVVYS
jgi:hypothetical protein